MPIDFKPKIQFTPKVQMPDANKILRKGAGKTWDWLNTSLTGMEEPTPEQIQKEGMPAAVRKGVVMMTTPLTLAGEALGGIGLLKGLRGLKAAPKIAETVQETGELARAKNIIEAYEGAHALKGTPEELIARAAKLDPLRYEQGSAPLIKSPLSQEPLKAEMPIIGKHGGAAHDDALIKQLEDEIAKTRNLEFVNPEEPANTRLQRIASERLKVGGDIIDPETGEVLQSSAHDIKQKSKRIRKVDPRIGKEILDQIAPPKVTVPNDRPWVSVGEMPTKQGELEIGRGAHEAPPGNVDFQTVGNLPDEQTGFGFGNDAPPPNFSWGDWWTNRPRGEKTQDVLGAAKSIQTSFDISWPLRQGRKIMHTKAWRQGVKEGLKAYRNEENAAAAMRSIRKDPDFLTAEKAGVDFTDLGSNLAKREEQFQSPLAEHLPLGIGRVVRASGRSYTVMGNKARLEYFKSLIKDPNVDHAAAADLVNTLTGRARLPGKTLEKAAPALNQVFYSPKALYSNVKTLNLWTYVNPSTPLQIKKEYAKSLLMMAGTTFAANNIAEALGAKVTWNPTSSDFGKIVIGKTHLDPMGGMQQPLVLTARLLTGKSTTSTGKTQNIFRPKYGENGAWDVIADFTRTKLAPIPGAAINTVTGQDPVGNETNAGKELLKLYTPLIGQDFLEVAKEDPKLAPVVAALVGIGVGQTTYNRKKKGGSMFSLPEMPSMPSMP